MFGTGNEVQRSTKQKLDLIYGVDFEGSSLLHLAIDSGVLKVTFKIKSYFFSFLDGRATAIYVCTLFAIFFPQAVKLCLDHGCSVTAVKVRLTVCVFQGHNRIVSEV